jgi:WD40 repeat protein
MFVMGNQKLLSASSDKTVKMWGFTANNVNLISTIELDGIPSYLLFDEHKNKLFIGYERKETSEHVALEMWNFSESKSKFEKKHIEHKAHKGKITSMSVYEDLLYTAGTDGEIVAWKIDCKNDTMHKHFGEKNRGGIYSLSINKTKKLMASVSQDCMVKIWDLDSSGNSANLKCQYSFPGYSGYIYQAKFVPNEENMLISSSNEDAIRVWDASLKKNNSTELIGHKGEVHAIAFSPADNNIFTSASSDNKIIIWDFKNRRSLKTLHEHNNRVWTLAFSPDGSILASGSYDGTVIIWDLQSSNEIYQRSRFEEQMNTYVYSLAFHPSSQNILVSSGGEQNIYVRNIDSGEIIKKFKNADRSWVASVLFSIDGKILFTGDGEGVIRLWDVDNDYQELASYRDHKDQIFSFVLRSDGEMLASSSGDGNFILWKINPSNKTMTRIAITKAHNYGVRSASFNQKGDIIVSAGQDNTIKLWNVEDPLVPRLKDTLRAYSPYEGLNITGTRGLENDKNNLEMLGAFDRQSMRQEI